MRILVVSDSHGRVSEIEKAIEAHPEAVHVFFLGDCTRDVEDLPFIYPDRSFHIVSGNCDFVSTYPSCSAVTLEGKRILFTHGHIHSVKSGLTRLKEEAKAEKADLVLYGHTHISKTEYADGIYYVNPGSLSRAAEGSAGYAVIDLTAGGIMPIHIKI